MLEQQTCLIFLNLMKIYVMKIILRICSMKAKNFSVYWKSKQCHLKEKVQIIPQKLMADTYHSL